MARRMLKHSMLAAPLLSMFVPHAWAQETPTAEIPENRPAQTASQVIYRGYNAGGLFLINEIAENVNFKLAVLEQSRGRLYLTLPQSKQPAQRLEREAGNDQLETREQLAAQIRNVDIAELASCDFAVFHFEGAELDAGTVVEFVIAKMLGMPTVVIRTDVRRQGEIGPDGPFNLMAKNYPRHSLLVFPALIRYEEILHEAQTDIRQRDGEPSSEDDLFVYNVNAEREAVVRLRQELASQVVEAIEEAMNTPNPYPDEEFREAQYRNLPHFAGAGLGAYLTPEKVENIIESKLRKGTL